MILILIRKVAIPVALIVAWIGTIISSVVMIKSNERIKNEEVQIFAMKSNEKNVTNIDEQSVQQALQENARAQEATSRSGSRVNRNEISSVYYEEIGITVSEEETEILERIVQAEAGGSGYDGMLAVANVVLNRVKSSKFPNNITDVVFAKRQFTPISDGRYYSVKVSDTAKEVVADALNGARLVTEDALYFCTPTASGKGWFETSLRKIEYIAPHNFYGYKLEE